MRYCSTCGTLNDTDAKFCSGCGKPFENAPSEMKSAYTTEDTYTEDFYEPQPPVYGPPREEREYLYPYQDPDNNPYAPQPQTGIRPKAKVFGILSFVFGLITIVWSWVSIIPIFGQIFGFIFLAMAIVGLIFGKKSMLMSDFRLARSGKVLCIIGLIFVIIALVVGIIILVYAISSGELEYMLEDFGYYIEHIF
ncbi:MAG: hypothetical protein J5483_07885 [Lachnospiraceae bacterium]|nr:hypothetical protein [Lachnospiraceae bacterium]